MKHLRNYCLMLVVIGGLLHSPISAAQDNAIAEVNGKPILEVAVWTPVALLELQHPNVSGDELTERDLAGAKERLNAQVLRILQEEAIAALGIEANPEAVDEATQARLDEAVQNTGKSLEELLAQLQQGQVIVDALREAQQAPNNVDALYEDMLAPAGVDENTWAFHLAVYHENPERIDELEANIPRSVDDIIEQTRQGIQREMELALLDQHIMGNAANDEDAEALRAQFLLESLEEADIVIHDEHLVGAIDALKDDFSNKAQHS